MTITLQLDDASLPAWNAKLAAAYPGNTPTVEQHLQSVAEEMQAAAVRALTVAQREALIPVADEILSAPPAKQQAAINAALAAVRS